MNRHVRSFDEERILHDLEHFLPSQAPLKDFIHHNTLHAFQKDNFHVALNKADRIFGYKVYLFFDEYRDLYHSGKINDLILNRVIQEKGTVDPDGFRTDLFEYKEDALRIPRIGGLRSNWKIYFKIDLDSLVHPTLFRIIGSYLDQGIAIWNFPHNEKGFLSSIQELEKNSLISFFKTQRVKDLLISGNYSLEGLLKLVVGDPEFYEQYLFDQQFAHPGWSGLTAVLDKNPGTLLDKRPITLRELIIFELLLEIDALDDQFGSIWAPLGMRLQERPDPLFDGLNLDKLNVLKQVWQEAYEWSYYDEVLSAVEKVDKINPQVDSSFQSIFCIDDRECSIRRYVEKLDPKSRTFGTAGFFNVEFYFQPKGGKFLTKVCPAPVTPKYLIKEVSEDKNLTRDVHFGKHSHGLLGGWLYTHTVGFWSAFKLFLSVFRPAEGEASVSSFAHMDPSADLTIENQSRELSPEGLQIGFTLIEMTDRLEGLLRSIGLTDNFAPLIYAVGHGSSSVNNTHYAGYDCGACSGRPGSVNARVICYIGNHPKVREILAERGIQIPETTQFVGALHDTSRDEIKFYDLQVLSNDNLIRHARNEALYQEALGMNSRERSRRFMSINSEEPVHKVHRKVKLRTVSLFEPRPELNHATNTLCLVGRREFSRQLFLDRRAFLNSFDYSKDPEGKYLLGILNAVAPVCGGINLEYFFSRMDNQQLGAGTKLPHNVMGLIGVANGIDGDLRTGLPSQMIEVHDPIRLMVIVEHYPEVVNDVIRRNPATFEWFNNDWVKLCAVHPESRVNYIFLKGEFVEYRSLKLDIPLVDDITSILFSTHENVPVHLINEV